MKSKLFSLFQYKFQKIKVSTCIFITCMYHNKNKVSFINLIESNSKAQTPIISKKITHLS